MKKVKRVYFLIGMLATLASCKEPTYIPRANKGELVKDSFYFYRDTLNFHHVPLPDYIVNSVDTIIQNHPLEVNYYWSITLTKEKGRLTYEIMPFYCEMFMLYLDDSHEPYKASVVNSQKVFIYDEKDLLPIDSELPYIRIHNPGKMTEFYKTSRPSWIFQKDRKGVVSYVD